MPTPCPCLNPYNRRLSLSSHSTFGEHTETFVTLNLQPRSMSVLAVRVGFSLAAPLAD